MRFCDFFIEYKIGLKNIDKKISWMDLPKYRKIFMIIELIFIALTVIFLALYFLLQSEIFADLFLIGIVMVVLVLLIFMIFDSNKINLKKMLDGYYSVCSYNRMNMLKNVLQKYSLDAKDVSTIDLLIEEAERAQKENDPFISMKKSAEALGAGIIPIIIYVAKEIAEEFSTGKLLYMALLVIAIIICLLSIFFTVVPEIKNLVYRDNNIYNDLIYDLRQLKIFSHQ
ncbi:MAG: cell envelope integrity protein CreD [Lachnospiraceae bacterium]|nr:cell envelope integrity protein CreD [Lachnospiraceae bacterium]